MSNYIRWTKRPTGTWDGVDASAFSPDMRTRFVIAVAADGTVDLRVIIPGPTPFDEYFSFKTVGAAKSFVTRHFG